MGITKTTTTTEQRAANLHHKSALRRVLEECSVCFYLWTFGLSLWSWVFACVVLYTTPWARLPLLMYITWILWSPLPCPFDFPAPLR